MPPGAPILCQHWARMSRRLLAFSWLVFGLVASGAARAQSEDETADELRQDAAPRLSPVGRFGVARLERWLASEDPAVRRRAIERLGELGTTAALERLTSYAFERRAQLVGRECLALARALAPHAADTKVQLVLAMLLNQSPSKSAGPEEAALSELWRGAAALSLAAEGGDAALAVLGRALRTAGSTAALAADALLAHPPEVLTPLLDAPGEATPALARLLGELGDQRAFHTLRGWVRGGTNELRGAAALALTELGHFETVPLGASWLKEGPAELRDAGLEILLLAQDARAEPVLRGWIEGSDVGLSQQRRLLEYPSPGLAAALVARVERGAPEAWPWALLGRVGGAAAAERLLRGLGEEASAFGAAHALSRWSGGGIQAGLASALGSGVAPALVLRVVALRARSYGEQYPALESRARELASAERASDRAAAAWVHALSSPRAALEELASGDALRVAAAASHVLWFGDDVCQAALRAAARAEPGPVRSALAACLRSPRARGEVTSELLWSLVAEAGGARPLALRALAARNDPGLWAALSSYLDHPDPLLREHVALGLGESDRPSAVGYLTRRLAEEADEGVRHALVIALGAHVTSNQGGRAAERWLTLAERLDPSQRVRAAARLARGGVRLADPGRGSEVLWARLLGDAAERSEPAASPADAADVEAPAVPAAPPRVASPGLPALVAVAPGLAIPVLADPAGLLVIPGLPVTHLGIRLQ